MTTSEPFLKLPKLYRKEELSTGKTQIRPAITPEGRENQLIALAENCALEKIQSGKASDSLLIHYLRLGSSKNRLEEERLKAEVELAKAKAKSIRDQAEAKAMFDEAIKAMQLYSGNNNGVEEGDDEEDIY